MGTFTQSRHRPPELGGLRAVLRASPGRTSPGSSHRPRELPSSPAMLMSGAPPSHRSFFRAARHGSEMGTHQAAFCAASILREVCCFLPPEEARSAAAIFRIPGEGITERLSDLR